jgi:hypothetical protein
MQLLYKNMSITNCEIIQKLFRTETKFVDGAEFVQEIEWPSLTINYRCSCTDSKLTSTEAGWIVMCSHASITYKVDQLQQALFNKETEITNFIDGKIVERSTLPSMCVCSCGGNYCQQCEHILSVHNI